MIDPELLSSGLNLLDKSPFLSVYQDNYNMNNQDLLKFVLQEQHKAKLKNNSPPNLHSLNSIFLTNSFNSHLQEIIESKNDILSFNTHNILDESKSDDKNFIDLKILIENSIFNSSKKNSKSILSFNELSNLKNDLRLNSSHKKLLIEKLKLSNDFLHTLSSNFSETEDTFTKEIIHKTEIDINYLNKDLNKINETIIELNEKLNNHYLSCLSLGYIEDVNLPANFIESISQPDSTILKSFDKLFSHIASISVKRSIQLPKPDLNDNSLSSRIFWTQECIDTILNESKLDDDNTLNDELIFNDQDPNLNSKQLLEYKVALDDLRFSHEYLTREFEEQRENFNKMMNNSKKKNATLEKELASTIFQLDKNSKYLIHKDLNFKELENLIETKDSEINKLRKELNFLKVDSLGFRSPKNSNPMSNPLSPIFDDDRVPLSPLNSEFNPLSSPRLTSSDSTSVGILRKEFKKLVEQIQNQFENELNSEKIERKRLENLLNLYQQEKVGLNNYNNFSENDDTLN